MASYLESKRPKDCAGCGACAEICPVHCITMAEKEDGFVFPEVNNEICLHCNKCIRTCPYSGTPERHEVKYSCAGKSGNDNACSASSSGGLFFALASTVLAEGGSVAGAALDENFFCRHYVIDKPDDLTKLMGSKYVQSECHPVFPQIKAELSAEKEVLFVGTPCQVEGLKRYLGREYENLICVDIACHGAPSAADFRECQKQLEKKHRGRLTYLKFRDKTRSGWNHSLTYRIERDHKEKTYTVQPYKVPYYYFFLHSMNIRESCYECPFVGVSRVGDITLADFWGGEKVFSEKEIGKGVSAILCNTEKGRRLLEKCSALIYKKDVDLADIVAGNQPFKTHCKEYPGRTQLLRDVLSNGYSGLRKYIPLKEYVIAGIKAAVPEKLKRALSR